MSRDARRAQKRRQQRKDAKRNRVERTGPGVRLDLGAAVSNYLDPFGVTSRKHVQGCTIHLTGGACQPGCESDAELLARRQERYG